MELRTLVSDAAKLLESSMEEEADAFFVTVGVSESEDEDEDDRTQMVMVELDEEGEVVVVSTEVGPFTEDMDLPEVLRMMRDAIFSRVYVAEATPEEPEQLVVEAALVLQKTDPEVLASVIQEVGEVADELEILLYGEEEDEDEDEDEDEGDDEDEVVS